jgi:hypothetical protein
MTSKIFQHCTLHSKSTDLCGTFGHKQTQLKSISAKGNRNTRQVGNPYGGQVQTTVTQSCNQVSSKMQTRILRVMAANALFHQELVTEPTTQNRGSTLAGRALLRPFRRRKSSATFCQSTVSAPLLLSYSPPTHTHSVLSSLLLAF